MASAMSCGISRCILFVVFLFGGLGVAKCQEAGSVQGGWPSGWEQADDEQLQRFSPDLGQTSFMAGIAYPPPLDGAQKIDEATLANVPTIRALKQWLLRYGLSTDAWGTGTTKTISRLWQELRAVEAQLEVYRQADGVVIPVRVTHVLRAKTCSKESREKGRFLLNTWQQRGDGKLRYRNRLLAEKLSIDELPLDSSRAHLKEVCERAVAEEMQRVVSSDTVINGRSTVEKLTREFNENETSPITVTDVDYVDHTIEIEESRSYPGLLTLYHLNTVEVVCDNLPQEDFNTLEYTLKYEVEGARHKLKYIHAWVWMDWNDMQRKFDEPRRDWRSLGWWRALWKRFKPKFWEKLKGWWHGERRVLSFRRNSEDIDSESQLVRASKAETSRSVWESSRLVDPPITHDSLTPRSPNLKAQLRLSRPSIPKPLNPSYGRGVTELLGRASYFIIDVQTAAVVGLFLGGGVIFARRHLRHGASTIGEEVLLAA